MKDVFILNPNSGRNNQYQLMNEIKNNFQGKRIIIEKTKAPGHATHIAMKYALDTKEPVHIFACGGDGTLHEIINGIAGAKHITLSILPIGTGNDFVKSLDGYRVEDLLDLSRYDKPIEKECDLLKINGEYVINTISFGFDVHVAKHVNTFRKKIKAGGIVPYYLGMLASLTKPLADTYNIQIDTNHLPEEKYTFVVLCNGRYYGGGYLPCPEAQIDDGLIDICMIKKVHRAQIVQLAGKYEKGEHVKIPNLVELYSGSVVHLDTNNENIDINCDGEVRTMKNPTIEIVPHSIRLLLPSKEM